MRMMGRLGIRCLLLILPAVPAAAQQVDVEGRVFVRWGDGRDGSTRLNAAILARDGARYRIEVGDAARPDFMGLARNPGGTLGVVRGSVVESPDGLVVRARSAGAVGGPMPSGPGLTTGLHGSQAFVTILCRFGDQTTTTPNELPYYQGVLGTDYPGQNHYWREQSYEVINTDGSVIVGWYDLPKTKAEYTAADDSWDLDLTAQDCAALADPDVDFNNFAYINFVVNDDVDGAAWGGGGSVAVEGDTLFFGLTWMPPWAQGHAVFGHEMGHAMGLPHSSGPYDQTYDSQWDVLSEGGRCSSPHPQYGCVSVHTVAYHKASLGWIPAARQVTVSAGSQTVTLDRLAQPPTSTNPLVVIVPIQGSATDYYTVEARVQVGYDAEIPGNAVVIHRIDTDGRADRVAQVVDPDANGNANDAGAMWVPGETFTDAGNGITITVDQALAGDAGFQITVTQGAAQGLHVTTTELPSGKLGEAYSAQLQAAGGDGTYTWMVSSGSLPAGLTLASDGKITGMPTALGTATAVFRVSSGGSSAEATLAIEVTGVALALDVTTAPPQGTMAVPYSFQYAATGGDGTYVWSVASDGFPDGLSLSESGLVSGTPTATGDFTFTVKVASAGQSVVGQSSITVVAPVLDGNAVLEQLLGTASNLASTDLDYLDLIGNRNGSFDVGDYLAWLRATGAVGAEIR